MAQTKLSNVMIDLETMGTKPYSAIISIGAVFFDPLTGETGDTFYEDISLDTCTKCGLVMDAGAVQWWIKQNKEAQKVFHGFKRTLPEALHLFNEFLTKSGVTRKTIKPWGNGSSFDITLLECAYEVTGIQKEWDYWNVRDVRTVVAMGEGYSDANKTMPRDGTYHNALDDSMHQVKYVCEILKKSLRDRN
jgi:hypothetical protein